MFEQVKLDYAFAALEPYIDALTMETHYSKHHATYTKNFNAAVEAAGIAGKSAEQILSSLDEVKDEASRKALRNNGGGYYNHNLYFEIMSPEKHSAPEGKLAAAIEKQFGSVEALKEKLTALAVGQFGSGWAWLVKTPAGELDLVSTSNAATPLNSDNTPLLTCDVWEHAYYIDYRNSRPNYLNGFWEIVNWDEVARRFAA